MTIIGSAPAGAGVAGFAPGVEGFALGVPAADGVAAVVGLGLGAWGGLGTPGWNEVLAGEANGWVCVVGGAGDRRGACEFSGA